VQGGSSNVVNLPSFGSDGGANGPALPGRSSAKQSGTFDAYVVATASSGGAFEAYKNLLPGRDRNTAYIDTSMGTVVMEYSDLASASHAYAGALVGPQGLRTDLPPGLPHSRLVVQGTLDASGNLKNLRVLEAGPSDMTAKIMAALPSWKFRPAMRGTQPVEVAAILGFGIDTNDRF
jgi:hypothetical protein